MRDDDNGPAAVSLGSHLTDPAREVLREVAHMLRSTLGSVTMMTETLRAQDARLEPEERARPLGIIHRAALSAATLAGDLLVVTEDEGGKAPPTDLRLGAALEEIADVVRPVAEARGCSLEVSALVQTVRVDSWRLRRAMLRLSLYAALWTREGEVHLGVARTRKGTRFTASVRGPGRAAGDQDADPFEIFRQGPPGEGFTLSADAIGLSAVERLLSQMGTRLHLDGDGDRELRMWFILPEA
jgi:signal transduction histidine kinase